uniref:Uncharacterized protein n=1 Tax=Amphimedon queenslandica TaxID=400682 RepID=A0A1X7V0W9_AMPQE
MDRLFNIIVSGIVESLVGTSRMTHINSDMDEVSSILSDLYALLYVPATAVHVSVATNRVLSLPDQSW